MPFAFAFHLHLILILSLAYVLKPFYCHNSKIPNTVNNDLDIRVLYDDDHCVILKMNSY